MSHSKSLSSVFTYQSWVHAFSGAVGGAFAMTVFYPLDTIRVRLQLENLTTHENKNTFAILKEIMVKEGFGSLYRGLVPVLESLYISNFVYFYTFHSLKAFTGNEKQQNAIKDLLLGCISGAVNVLLTTPFWVVNTRLKMKGLNDNNTDAKNYNNLIQGLIYIYKTEGLKGLWASTIPSLMLVINPALQFMLYEQIKRKMTSIYGDLSSITYFAIGALSKAFATILTYPLQLVQTKQRHGNNETKENFKNIGTIQLLMRIVKENGPKGLFRGLEAKILQTVMTAALMFAAYEKIAKYVAMILISQNRSKKQI